MMRYLPASLVKVSMFCLLSTLGCGGGQNVEANIETRPLQESKAFEIIEEVLAERGYSWEIDAHVEMASKVQFKCDYRVKDHMIAIEFLTESDRELMGPIPPPAAGSRLHVLRAGLPPAAPNLPTETVYIFFVDDRKFVYHFNPTSEHRADVTLLEVDSRLRRDLADFLSWYESSTVKR